MDQNLLKLIDTWQVSYDAWEHGLKHVREWAKNGRERLSYLVKAFDILFDYDIKYNI